MTLCPTCSTYPRRLGPSQRYLSGGPHVRQGRSVYVTEAGVTGRFAFQRDLFGEIIDVVLGYANVALATADILRAPSAVGHCHRAPAAPTVGDQRQQVLARAGREVLRSGERSSRCTANQSARGTNGGYEVTQALSLPARHRCSPAIAVVRRTSLG